MSCRKRKRVAGGLLAEILGSNSAASRSGIERLTPRTTADQMAARRKSNRTHVDPCAVTYRKRVVSWSSHQPAVGWIARLDELFGTFALQFP